MASLRQPSSMLQDIKWWLWYQHVLCPDFVNIVSTICSEVSVLALAGTASFKKMNNFFEWIFGILKKWILFLNEYSGFKKNEYFVWMNILDFKKMNILIEWIFWIFIKWIIFLTNILVLVCQRQKLSSINVSKSSEIIQGSLMGPNLVHFRGSFTYTGASGRLRSHILASFWNFE